MTNRRRGQRPRGPALNVPNLSNRRRGQCRLPCLRRPDPWSPPGPWPTASSRATAAAFNVGTDLADGTDRRWLRSGQPIAGGFLRAIASGFELGNRSPAASSWATAAAVGAELADGTDRQRLRGQPPPCRRGPGRRLRAGQPPRSIAPGPGRWFRAEQAPPRLTSARARWKRPPTWPAASRWGTVPTSGEILDSLLESSLSLWPP